MGKPKVFVFDTRSSLVNMGTVNQFLYRKMVLFAAAFWVFICTYLLPLFRFISRTKNLFRLYGDDNSRKENSNSLAVIPQDNNQSNSNSIEFKDFDEHEESSEEETPKFFFKFQFQTYEDFSRSNGGNKDSGGSSTSKYEFLHRKTGFSGFVEEPEVENFTMKELLYLVSNNESIDKNKIVNDDEFLSEKDFVQPNSEAEAVHEEKPENPTIRICKGEAVQDVQFLSEDLLALDSDSESITSSPEFSFMSHLVDSSSDGFLSDKDFGGEFELDTSMNIDGEKKVELAKEVNGLEEIHMQNSSFYVEDREIMEELEKLEESHIRNSSNDREHDDFDTMEELQKLEESAHPQNLGELESEFLTEKDFEIKQEEFVTIVNEPKDGLQNSGKPNSQNSSEWKSEEEDSHRLETLWEHQDLIEQLKMELRKVRATGLPTILEESESPKIMEDLQPWKIDEKFQHEDPIGELHKFYKSYRERMRKFDILNYQKMYAIGFLQSKDPLQSVSSSHKSSTPAITSLLLQNFRLCKRKKPEFDPTMKFIRELHSDLEMVYVGQMCLSWEFLHWQYEKALELWESDPRGVRRYNEVAGEFQQFQVLMQRFIENGPFQGPRVQNYVKNRCVLRNLLQVPVIREDSLQDKKRRTGRGDDAITSDMLVEIMEESIRIFWRFVRADKEEANVVLKFQKGTQVELQDPADSELLSEVRTNLQKKEKKLKELLRTGNCILKKFQKNQGDSSDQVLYFFSQVDMKLVSRVINMSRISTDQLVWCRSKLSKISFVNRKIHVEPSFLLFPC